MSTSLTTSNNMEKFNMEYSKKNIPIPSQEEYKVYLISKVEKFIKRMRWKALQFLGKLDSSEKQTFGFRSRNCPPAVEELANFEDDLMLMTKNVEFRNINNTFQEKLKNDIKELRESDKNLFQRINPLIYIKWKKMNIKSYYLKM